MQLLTLQLKGCIQDQCRVVQRPKHIFYMNGLANFKGLWLNRRSEFAREGNVQQYLVLCASELAPGFACRGNRVRSPTAQAFSTWDRISSSNRCSSVSGTTSRCRRYPYNSAGQSHGR